MPTSEQIPVATAAIESFRALLESCPLGGLTALQSVISSPLMLMTSTDKAFIFTAHQIEVAFSRFLSLWLSDITLFSSGIAYPASISIPAITHAWLTCTRQEEKTHRARSGLLAISRTRSKVCG